MSRFKKAERKNVKLKAAITGASGSGKTLGALILAQAMGKKIAVIDTENGSASLYSDRFSFDTIELRPPYTAQSYIDAIRDAVAEGYDFLVVDSLSHVWAGEGGVLDKKNALDSRGGNQFANWKVPKAEHQKFKDAVLFSPIHTVVTIRSKQGYQIDDQTKKVIRVGLDPIAEPGIEYEYTVVFDVDSSHNATTSKDRTALFDGKIFKITEATGKELHSWLNFGKSPESGLAAPESDDWQKTLHETTRTVLRPSEGQLKRLFAIAGQYKITNDEIRDYISKNFKVESTKELTMDQYNQLCKSMETGT